MNSDPVKEVRRRRPKGDGYLLLRVNGKWLGDREARKIKGGVWYANYTFQGRKIRESSKPVGTRDAAARLLRKRLREIADGVFAQGAARVSLGHLRDLVVSDYARNGRKTAGRVWGKTTKGESTGLFANLIRILGEGVSAERIPYQVEKYVATRLEEGAANATVNRELAALGRGFKLAVQKRLLSNLPYFPRLDEPAPRNDYLERDQLETILPHLPERLRDPMLFAFLTGCRIGRVLALEWRHVDERNGEIRLDLTSSATKTAGRVPYAEHPELAALLARRRAETDAWQRERGEVVPWVFWYPRSKGIIRKGGTRKAAPIRVYVRQWRDACDAAGLRGRTVHGLRRSFAVQAKRRGVEDKIVMEIGGWKTRSVLDRYRIIDTTDLREGMRKLARRAPDVIQPAEKAKG